METIKISQESLDAFKKQRSLIPAPFDNKNLMEDALTDNVFENFYQAVDHYKTEGVTLSAICISVTMTSILTDTLMFLGKAEQTLSSSNYLQRHTVTTVRCVTTATSITRMFSKNGSARRTKDWSLRHRECSTIFM